MKCRVEQNDIVYILNSDLVTWSEEVVSSNNSVEINFSWGDVSPELIYEITNDITITEVYLSIDVLFDGVGAYIKVGDDLVDDSLMESSENDVTTEAVYSTEPMKLYSVGRKIFISFFPGAGATQGKGSVIC